MTCNLLKNEGRGVAFYFCLVVAFCALRFSWFENFADLKFFGGVHLPFDLWIKAFPVSDGYVVAPCSAVEQTLRVGPRVPVLFKGCIPEDLHPTEFIYFPESQTNVFPECEARVERHWNYEPLDGEIQHFHEWYPCTDARPLREKVDEWLAYDQETQGTHSELHVYMMGKEEKRGVVRDFAKKNITDMTPTFLDAIPTAIANFFHVGQTAVDYFHSHMDHGLMFNFKATKVWTLIAPDYHDYFDYKWSGNANVLLKEHKVAPRVVIEQEQGDILYVPTWWLHKVGLAADESPSTDGKNFGLSLHMMRSDQFTGIGANVAEWFGITNWFYRDSFDGESLWGTGADEKVEVLQ